MVHSIKITFTLIELIVVLTTISILVALLIPALNMAVEHSSQIGCAMNLRQIGVAGEMRNQDNNGVLYDYPNLNAGYAYQNTLAPYLNMSTPLWDNVNYNYTAESEAWNCPSSDRFLIHNYAYNSYGFMIMKRMSLVNNPSEKMHFADQYSRGGNSYDFHCWNWSSVNSTAYYTWSKAARHFDSNEVLFLDGHVDQVEVISLKAPKEICH